MQKEPLAFPIGFDGFRLDPFTEQGGLLEIAFLGKLVRPVPGKADAGPTV